MGERRPPIKVQQRTGIKASLKGIRRAWVQIAMGSR